MHWILIGIGAIGLVVVSLTAAAVLCWCLWYGFRLVLHPEWEAPAVLTLVGLALVGALPKSQFLNLTLAFAVFTTLPLWFEGRVWRRHRRQAFNDRGEQSVDTWLSELITPIGASVSPRLYPAIISCIGEQRPPTRDEVRLVAARLWREGLAPRVGSQSLASFAARRVLLRGTIAALSGEKASRH